MRTLDEIKVEINLALRKHRIDELHQLAAEANALGTAEAQIEAEFALGSAADFASDYGAALEHYERARSLSIEKCAPFDVARYHHNVGVILHAQGDYAKALEQYRIALTIREERGDRQKIPWSLSSIGQVQYETGDYASAMQHFRRALAGFEDVDDQRMIANVLVHIGNVFFVTDDYPRALEHYHRALRIQEDLGLHAEILYAICNIGMVYKATGEYEKALTQYHRALGQYETQGNHATVAYVLSVIGSVYSEQDDHEQCLTFLERSLQIYREIGDRAGTARVLNNMTSTLIEIGRISEAAVLVEQLGAMSIDQRTVRAQYHENRAALSELAGDLDVARDELQRALQIAVDLGRRAQAASSHRRLRDLARKRNDFDRYIEHNTEYQRITDEIRGKEATQRLTMMEVERQNETDRREREKERALLYGALPESVAKRMLRGEDVTGDHYDEASVLFLDIVGFTELSDKLPPNEVVQLLDQIFSALDEVTVRNGLMKIKTIGDSYMAIAIESNTEDQKPNTMQAVNNAARAAVQMLATLAERHPDIRVRIGIHVGPVTAGVIGKQRLQYDVWGDTVNVASRMESTGEPGRIHVSEAFATALDPGLRRGDDVVPDSLTSDSLTLFKRGITDVKGKGPMTTYWLEGL